MTPPTTALIAHNCLWIILVIGKYTHIFGRGGGEDIILCWSFFHGEIFRGEENFKRVELVRGYLILEEFARILIQKSSYISCFLFSVSILRVELLRIIVWGKFSPGLNCLEDVSAETGFLR